MINAALSYDDGESWRPVMTLDESPTVRQRPVPPCPALPCVFWPAQLSAAGRLRFRAGQEGVLLPGRHPGIGRARTHRIHLQVGMVAVTRKTPYMFIMRMLSLMNRAPLLLCTYLPVV